MKKTLTIKRFSAVLLLCIAVAGAYAVGQIISNIYQHAMTVSEAKLMTISPDPSTPFPNETITGQSFNISINVENPNPVALKGRILLTFTVTGIALDSVSVTSDWSDPPKYQLSIHKTLEGDALSFKIYPNYLPDPYFTFEPGSNLGVVYFSVTYNTAGSYDVTLAVVAT